MTSYMVDINYFLIYDRFQDIGQNSVFRGVGGTNMAAISPLWIWTLNPLAYLLPLIDYALSMHKFERNPNVFVC